ncbi:unnamed protein product [Linum tenue]|uniref:Uncharacterized protein n=1 Tax=Linum tenue TaxID=586396 RepID=A0AAV0Q1W6_9ROSI|nr:unnamed protein product [Linum tenue]
MDCLNSRVDRRLSQLFEVVNKNKSDFDEFRRFLTTPIIQSKALPLDGGNSNPNSNSGNLSSSPVGGGNGQPRQDNLFPPMTNHKTPHRMNRGEIPATTQVEGIPNVGVGEIPPRGENLGVTHSAPVEPPHIPIPVARLYTVHAHMGGGVGLAGGVKFLREHTQHPCHPISMGMAWTPWVSYTKGGNQGGMIPTL